MRILAKAYPNPNYEYLSSIRDMVLEARLVNNKVEFYETHTKNPQWVVRIQEETVMAMFDSGEVLNRFKPFIKKENLNFYFIVHRTKFTRQYQRIKMNYKNEAISN